MASDNRSFKLLLRARALELLAQPGGPPDAPVSVFEEDGATAVYICVASPAELASIIGPSAKRDFVGEFTPCERDILSVLRAMGRPMMGLDMLAELERRGLIHGESTVLKALTRLRKVGVLRLSSHRPRGYFLPAA